MTKTLSCKECGRTFVWSLGEQRYYEEHGLAPPIFCQECLSRRRVRRLQGLLKTHRGNLHQLELQASRYGPDQPLPLLNLMEHERAEVKRLEQELLAPEETQSPEDDVIQADVDGSAVVVGDVATMTIGWPDRSQPMSEILEELSRMRGAITDLTSKFHEATMQRAVAASILGDVELQQEEDLCFVLMPFKGDVLQEVYEVHIKPTVERVGLQCRRADDILGPTPIMEDIWKGINSARVVLAELTGQSPNVFYELGLCHAIGKDAILMAQDINWVLFDVRHRRTIVYTPTPRGCKQLEEVLGETLEAMLGKAPVE